MKRDPRECLPLSPPALHVLLGLVDGEKHGYAILKAVNASGASGTGADRPLLSVSTLYSSLQRLEADGLIAEADERPDPALDDERRRYFRITDFGREVARAELRRLEDTLALARSKHLEPDPT